ncbi:centromere protein I [Cladorrhinum sp. PSN259]|nr:centromere protein I [Cladorrhinum sp. PSN259]
MTSSSPPPSADLESLLGEIETAAQLPAKRRLVGIKPAIEKAASVLYDKGALPQDLARLVDLLTVRNHLDQASLGAIVRNLYPLGKVGDEVVLRFVGALGHGHLKPSFPLQGLFLRWLVMVHHLLENPSILSQVYAVLFNLLDTAAIRPQLCHLLALITRRKHVRPFRIQTILNLSRQTGGDPNLTGLLRVFKNYYPEIIVGDLTKGRAAAFKHPDPQWRERLNIVQQQHRDSQLDSGVRNAFSVNHALGRQLKGAKAIFPTVNTQHAQESSVTLEEITSAEQFVQNLEKIEMPTQLVAVLADPLLQKFLLLRPDAEAFSRVSNWLMACVGDVASGDADPALWLDMVEVIRDYALSTKTLPPVLLTFLADFLKTWNGRDRKEVVLDTLSFIPPMKFQDLHQLLHLLEHSILDNTAESQTSLIKFYTQLLRRWTVTMQAHDGLLNSVIGSSSSIPDLITHINTLALTLSQTSPTTSTYLTILDFYSACASVYSNPILLQHMEIAIPPPLLVYLLNFSPSLAVLSRLCGTLAIYKRAWELVMSKSLPTHNRSLTKREREQINVFNGFLMDICNCLWRGRAFARSDLNAQGCRIPAAVPRALEKYVKGVDSDLELGGIFTISFSPLLCLQAINFVRAVEDRQADELLTRHAGPVTPGSLGQLGLRGGLRMSWAEYRSGVLRYLDEEKGMGGVPALMYNTMKNLMKARNG